MIAAAGAATAISTNPLWVVKRRLQTRMDQITQQLKFGISEFENNENVSSVPQDPDHISSTYQVDKEGAEQLDLEKQEAIGVLDGCHRLYRPGSYVMPCLIKF